MLGAVRCMALSTRRWRVPMDMGMTMPTIATHEVDTVGVQTVRDWIDAL